MMGVPEWLMLALALLGWAFSFLARLAGAAALIALVAFMIDALLRRRAASTPEAPQQLWQPRLVGQDRAAGSAHQK